MGSCVQRRHGDGGVWESLLRLGETETRNEGDYSFVTFNTLGQWGQAFVCSFLMLKPLKSRH